MKEDKEYQDEFDRLLDEFIANDLAEREENANRECDDDLDDDDDDEFDAPSPKRLINNGELTRQDIDDSFDDDVVIFDLVVDTKRRPARSKAQQPRVLYMGDGSTKLHLHLDFLAEGDHGDLELRVVASSNENLAIIRKLDASLFYSCHDDMLHLEVDIADLLANLKSKCGCHLRVEFFNKEHRSIKHSVVKVARVGSASDLVSFNRIILGNIPNGSNALAMDITTPYVQFAEHEMDTLSALFVVTRRTEFKCDDLDPYIRLICPNGKRLENRAFTHTYDDGAVSIYSTFDDGEQGLKWERGIYRVQLMLDDKLVASVPMTIGDNRVEGEIDINNMLSSLRLMEANSLEETKERKGTALKQLNAMAGLEDIKRQVKHLGSMARLAEMRRKQGLPAPDLALHALFKGSSGTGKTTVAKLMGRIYRDMGLLSSGHIVVAERRTLTGRYYDSEARAVEQAIASARGGILFIDEAYMLNVKDDPRDPGHKVLEHLLTALSDKGNRDWMLILAGYTKEMDELMNSNPGLSSRISNLFTFNDYGVDELVNIAEIFCREQQYTLTTEARTRLRAVIERDYALRDENFGNGRYVVNLLEQRVLPSLAQRVARLRKPTREALQRIVAEDIPISAEEMERQQRGAFDNEAIDEALRRLDNLTGQHNVKQAIHNFVTFARHMQLRGERFVGDGILRWNFAGSSGMGKSTVAAILADILRAMGLVHRSGITEVRTSHLYASSGSHAESVLRGAVERACHSVLLIDNDAATPFNALGSSDVDPVQMHLKEITREGCSPSAIIVAECRTTNHAMADNLARQGIYDYDHTLLFDDLTSEELWEILRRRMERYNAHFDKDAEAVMREYIGSLCASRDPKVANARTIKLLSRTILEQVVLRESREQSRRGGKPRRTKRVVKRADVESYRWMPTTKTIGYGAI